jgi:predicted TIM-barrel fold metal-dependent hydrolase
VPETSLTFPLLSVDDHLIEPPGVWVDRLPARYREVGPRVVHEEGRDWWVYEDRRCDTPGLNAVAGKDPSQWSMDPASFGDMIPGCYNPKARLADIGRDGIVGSLCFPTLPRFSGTRFVEFHDKTLAGLCVRAYNDWMLDEWCGAAPDVFIPLMIVPLWDPPAAADEVLRCAARGVRAVSFPENPYPVGLPSFNSDSWDPLWRAVVETDMAVCLHVGTSGVVHEPSPDSHFIVQIMASPIMTSLDSMIDVMMSPTLQKFPALKLVMSEGGIGWVPGAIERADRIWELNRLWAATADLRPSELFARNFWVCFVDEPFGVASRHIIGVDRIMWECDYPHAETPWPHSQEVVRRAMQDVPPDEVAAMTYANAARVFNWTMPKGSA